MIDGMKATIDSAGRLVIPKSIREAARIRPGTMVELVLVGDLIELRPVPAKVRMRKEGRLLVATAGEETGPLSTATVEKTTEAVRERQPAAAPPGRSRKARPRKR